MTKKNKIPIYDSHRDLINNEWNHKENDRIGLDPKKLTYGSNKKAQWKCKKGHEWESKIENRTIRGQNCPYCCGHKLCADNCLSSTHPELIEEWDYKNNKLTPQDVSYGSRKKVQWICKKGHRWKASSPERVRGNGCPYCAGQKTCIDNCLATVNPELASEWNIIKNYPLTPYDVTSGSDKKVYWTCEKGHEFKSFIYCRNNLYNKSISRGCLICSQKNMTGKNNHNYNPNLTDKEREANRSRQSDPKYKKWVRDVYKKDNYTCQICFKPSSGHLNAHHLMGFDNYPKLRYNKTNGTTLCKYHHVDFHNIYGYGNNTLQQFVEYEKNYKKRGLLKLPLYTII